MKDTREHILTASFKLFLQKSFKEVTMKEIVERSGLSKGAFYHYFSSKEQVFEEVMDHFFAAGITQNFENYSYESLKEFCQDHFKDMIVKLRSFKSLREENDEPFSANHYFLIFDAMKMLPSYKQKLLESSQQELKYWKKIVHIAKKNGEIKTTMTDEQVARLFIYTSDGFGMHMIMSDTMGQIDKIRNELQPLLNGLYESLKG